MFKSSIDGYIAAKRKGDPPKDVFVREIVDLDPWDFEEWELDFKRQAFELRNPGTHHLFHRIRRFPPWFPLLQMAPGLFLNACQMLMINPGATTGAILAMTRIYPISHERSNGIKRCILRIYRI